MFNTVQVGRKIKELRLKNNLTQMNLADAMGVSYQAVSNWERGNSMPDIGKLAELSEVLHCTIDELLGNSKATELVKAAVDMEENGTVPVVAPDLETLAEVAPILKPNQTAALTEMVTETAKTAEESIDLHRLIGLAPFLDDELLDELLESALRGGGAVDITAAVSLAPFLSEKSLGKLAGHLETTDPNELAAIAPFMGDEALDALAEKLAPTGNVRDLVGLAPFLSDKALDRLTETAHGSLQDIVPLAPFLSEKALDKMILNALDNGADISSLTALAPFAAEKTLDAAVQKVLENGGDLSDCAGLFPFLSGKTMHALVKAMMKNGDFSSLKNMAPFL